MSKDPFADHESFRSDLVTLLRRQLFGPVAEDGTQALAETLSISPLQLYATGVLFPQQMPQDLLEDESEQPTVEDQAIVDSVLDPPPTIQLSDRRGNSDAGPSSSEREPLNLANEFSPSACGISFSLSEPASLKVTVTCGTYHSVRVTEQHPRAGSRDADGQSFPETREVQGYRRTAHEQTVDVAVTLETDPRTRNVSPLSIEGLSLHTTIRRIHGGKVVVSTMVVNNRTSIGTRAPACEDAYFQVAVAVRQADGKPVFHPIDRSFGEANNDPELASLELLYRHRRAFALGHGTASDWNRDEKLSESGTTDMVCSVAVPCYELKPIRPRDKAFRPGTDLSLSMAHLYDPGGDASSTILKTLEDLAADYEAWIDEQVRTAEGLPSSLKQAAESNLQACRTCHSRMLRGIDTLKRDERAMLAFRLMNKAMLIQQHHSRLPLRQLDAAHPDPDGYKAKRTWRPFQLAFILMNLAAMSDPSHPEREIVDLIWFPTGGGKTEAYLGLAAFTICLDRLSGFAPGVTVLMRYTLRLLTAQQFQRASALVLALETLRQDRALGADLGNREISIGLWVGQSLSPNTREQARTALKSMSREKFAPNPFQVLQCPWCGVTLTDRKRLGYREGRRPSSPERTVQIVCSDASCRFGERSAGLPVVVIDEDIYETPPTILIGTVDKFAQIAWDDRTGRLFGLGTPARPPSLIIQDELHLISGPLGTMVGLYETAIDRLCSREGQFAYKIVASTATIRRAREQCHALYARSAFEFPAQAVRAGESYFAFEDTGSPGRLYVGFMGNAVKSHQTALVRACSPLLQGVCHPIPDEDPRKLSIADPYGTVVWYFNSLRELGHAATLCAGDIPEFLKGFCHRQQIPYENRRYVREVIELTSRRKADEIPSILQQLEIQWRMKPAGKYPVDVLLATNMIAVGVDVSRLGLIVISGQPKGTSEYIQASSRIGRAFPGLVVTVYAQTKSRDRSHYERFVAYHQGLYRYVEPASVTPFSPQARDRGLKGLLIAQARLLAGVDSPDVIDARRTQVAEQIEAILARAEAIDDAEAADVREELATALRHWRNYAPPEYGRMGGVPVEPTLAYPFGSVPHADFQAGAWPILTSMRNVDGTSAASVLHVYDFEGQERTS